ncbi:MAG: hypothetical protein QNI90_09525 [Dinoroseobacter sp.]|nr:hypothetical protein [Dinoroseobacter sp.]
MPFDMMPEPMTTKAIARARDMRASDVPYSVINVSLRQMRLDQRQRRAVLDYVAREER